MLTLAANDDDWDVVMVGFNIINQSARQRVLPWTQAKRIGTLGMFAVRRALSDPAALRALVMELVTDGQVDAADFEEPLGFLDDITDGAYRFCRYEPGIDVILSGTGNVEHLKANAASLSRPPLPPDLVERLHRIFARVDSVSGN